MKTFVDNVNRTWSIAINIAAVKRVKDLLDIDLLEVLDGALLEKLASDPVLLCDCIYVLCLTEADARNVSDEEFGQAMAGEAIDRAACAFMEELTDFFPSAKRRILQKALAKLKTLEERIEGAATQRLDSGIIEQLIERELAKSDQELAAILEGGDG